MVVSYKVLREQVAKKLSGLQSENAKLQAERDVLHGALMKAGGLADIDRWPERYPLVYGCMTDAIKEIASGD